MRRFIFPLLLANLALSFATAAHAATDAGRTAFASRCASCHAVASGGWQVSAQAIQAAINANKGGMRSLSDLSPTDLQNIADYLANPNANTATASNSTATNTTPAASPSALPSNADIDHLYDWAEARYPQLFTSHGISQDEGGYYRRQYPFTNLTLLASRDGQLYFYDANRPNEGMLALGKTIDWVNHAYAERAASTRRPENDHSDDHEGHDENERDDDHDD